MSKRVPEGWNETQFSAILSERKERLPNDGRVPLFSLTIKDGISPKTARYEREFLVSNKGTKTYKVIHPNDLVFNPSNLRWGAIARSKVKYPVLASPIYEVVYPTSSDVIDPIFLDYIAHSDHMHLEYLHYMEGTLVERTALKIEHFMNLTVHLPPLPEQKKIASILTSVDEVIEKTQSQIDKLQDLKKATMNDLLTKGIDHSEFQDSEFGRIPKSWKIKTIEELTSKVVDGPHSTPKYVDKGIPFVTVKNITSGEVKFTDLKYITEEDYYEFMRRGKPDLGDILYSKDGSIGHTAIVHTERKFAYFVSVALLKIRQNLVNSKFINYALRSEYIWRQTELLNEGSGLKHMVLKSIKALKICLPSEEEQIAISQILHSIDKTIHCQIDKLVQTQSLKKSLMQDLLTGKVRVKVN